MSSTNDANLFESLKSIDFIDSLQLSSKKEFRSNTVSIRVSSLHDLKAFMAAFTSISSVHSWLLMKLLWKHLARVPQHPMNYLSEISFKIASSLKGWFTFNSSSFLAWRTNLFVRDALVILMHFILVLSIASSAESFLFILFCRFAAFLAIFSFCLLFDRRLPKHWKWIKHDLNVIMMILIKYNLYQYYLSTS